MTTYEKLMVTKRLNYIPYWLIVGLVIFLQQEAIVWATGDIGLEKMRVVRILISFSVSIYAILIIYLANNFPSMVNAIKTIIVFPTEDVSTWISNTILDLATFRTPFLRVMSLVFYLLFCLTVFALGFPYKSVFANINLLISLFPFSITSAHGIYGVGRLLILLSQLVRFKLNPPFYFSKHPAVDILSKFYLRVSFGALFVTAWLSILAWFNPYGLHLFVIFWLAFLSFLPLSLFVWSFVETHTLMRRIKLESVKTINDRLQKQLSKVLEDDASLSISEQLAMLMDIQKKVEGMSEWPISINGLTTLFATFILPAVNIAIGIVALDL